MNPRSQFILLIILFSTLQINAQKQVDSLQWWHGKERVLRYHPEGTDFVITNGNRRFTRALYGTHSAFRVEAGDLPEFALYMPGMGGNLQFGLILNGKSKWLINAEKIIARYRPGSMIYEIEDRDLLGKGKLRLTILAMADAEGMIIKVQFDNVNNGTELCWAFGGASGKKFSRDGDMGPDPESSFYLKPENCGDNRFVIKENSFILKYGSGDVLSEEDRYEVKHLPNEKVLPQKGKEKILIGVFPPSSITKIADASQLGSPLSFFPSNQKTAPVLAGKLKITNGREMFFAVQNPATKTELSYANASAIFDTAEDARKTLAERVIVHTPDPFINTIGGALSIAADAIWESPSYLHGSIGWRMRLNGWRGPYVADVLGWHDRARSHFSSYAQSQVISPDNGKVVADTALHLARQLEKLGTAVFSSGYISRNPGGDLRAHHYDMNLVYIDELLHHFQWTGDLAYVNEMWPVLKLHLAWEKRNFDQDGDGLYDAYAAIWASDALQYSGGGVTHSSAYNYKANKMAAEIAKLIGEDATPYQAEAAKIMQAINSKLWLTDQGVYAEYKDLLGLQLVHPSAALWSIYHSIDSDVPDAFKAYQSVRYIDASIPHIPVKAKGLKDEGYYTLSTTNWMPYVWSLNNVAMAEIMHTSLANWQAGRNEEAFKLWKSEILSSMYLGGSPGNIGQISFYDAARGEAYRDFGDPIGMTARSLVEGLFGILPDALQNQLTIKPGFPRSWNEASIHLPDIDLQFKRNGATETYTMVPSFPKQMNLRLLLKAYTTGIENVFVNDKKVDWKNMDSAVGTPMIEINSTPLSSYIIKIIWKAEQPDTVKQNLVIAKGDPFKIVFPRATIKQLFDPQKIFTQVRIVNNQLAAIINGESGSKTAFVQLKQGQLSWWQNINVEVKQPITIIASTQQSRNGLLFRLKNNSIAALDGILKVNDAYSVNVPLASGSLSDTISIPSKYIIPGSNVLIYSWDGKSNRQDIINWNVDQQAGQQVEMVKMDSFFNDKVTNIFKNQYLSPRPNSPTLQLPTQGIGEWTYPLHTVLIDDNGLRKAAGINNTILLPQGIPMQTSGDPLKKNILFTSQWDNYPHSADLPLTGKASHAYFLMAGSTNPMQSRMTNAVIAINYTDGTGDSLALKNPETWWPIEQDYMDDGYAFQIGNARPVRVHLKTGLIVSDYDNSILKYNGKQIEGGAATVFDLPLNPKKQLRSLSLKTLTNDVVIGLMGVTLVRGN